MKIPQFSSNILIIIPILLIFPMVNSSTSCSIFPSLNCSCFQSNVDLNLNLSIKTYSHLYCQGNSLTEKSFQSPFGSDFKDQNRFRTVSIEFFIENRTEIQSNQFDSLAMLFSKTNLDAQIDIYLRFNTFNHITFHPHSLTSTIFQQKHQNKHLWLHLIPARQNLTQTELDEENSTNIIDQFNFSSNCFSGLIVSQFTIYIHTVRDRFPSSLSFEHIFNNTNIGQLHFHGAIIRPDRPDLKQTFKGSIRSLTLHRHVDTIDSHTFPFYSHVYSYTIHSIEAHSMNLSSFLLSHTNLRGLEIIKPRFDVSIDQLIPTLDSLTLDIEHLNEKTLLAARHIYNLKLGSHLRTINPQIFVLLSRRLHHLDLSDIELSQMTIDSRCHLITYLSKNSQQHLNIIFPRLDNLTECDCARLFLNHIQLSQKLKENNQTIICSQQCHFSDCQTISEYFKEKYPLFNKENQPMIDLNETVNQKNALINDLPAIDLFSDPVDVDMMTFLINQTSDQELNETQSQSSTSTTTLINIDFDNIPTLENIQEYDDIISFSTPKLPDLLDDNKTTESISSNQNQFLSWLSFLIGIGVIILLLLIIGIIIYFVIQYRKEHNFKPLPVYV